MKVRVRAGREELHGRIPSKKGAQSRGEGLRQLDVFRHRRRHCCVVVALSVGEVWRVGGLVGWWAGGWWWTQPTNSSRSPGCASI